jgi:hypothetical protein
MRPQSDLHGFIEPETFLALTSTTVDTLREKGVNEMAAIMQDPNAEVPIPFLDVDYVQEKYDDRPQLRVTGHEGRHRAAAAMGLGIKAIPVLFWLREDGAKYPHHRRADDPDVEANPLVVAFTKPATIIYVWSQRYGYIPGKAYAWVRVVPMAPPKVTAQYPRIRTAWELAWELGHRGRR